MNNTEPQVSLPTSVIMATAILVVTDLFTLIFLVFATYAIWDAIAGPVASWRLAGIEICFIVLFVSLIIFVNIKHFKK